MMKSLKVSTEAVGAKMAGFAFGLRSKKKIRENVHFVDISAISFEQNVGVYESKK